MDLFETPLKMPEIPEFDYSLVQHLYDEIELLGFPVSGSWFDMLRTDFRGDILAHEMPLHVGKTVRMVGVYVAYKLVRTKLGEIMMFGNYLDVEGNFFDTVHFPNSYKEYRFEGHGAYLVLGTVTIEFGCVGLTVTKCAKISVKGNPMLGDEKFGAKWKK